MKTILAAFALFLLPLAPVAYHQLTPPPVEQQQAALKGKLAESKHALATALTTLSRPPAAAELERGIRERMDLLETTASRYESENPQVFPYLDRLERSGNEAAWREGMTLVLARLLSEIQFLSANIDREFTILQDGLAGRVYVLSDFSPELAQQYLGWCERGPMVSHLKETATNMAATSFGEDCQRRMLNDPRVVAALSGE